MVNSEFSKNSVFAFPSEVDYSKGGIVSKNVIKKDSGNVSLFAFDRGETIA